MAVFAAQHQPVACDTLKMNQLCKVCGEPAAGFHFGAFTCEGCKSFFGRSYNNLSVISECKNGGQCVINKKNRTSCKACRLRKCLLVGMSKSGSRYGRRSNWFKLHCLMQEQGPVSVPTTSPSSSSNNNNGHSTGSAANPNGPSPNSSADSAAAFRRGFHHHLAHHHHMMNSLNTQASSMSSNESKDDADVDCKNSSASPTASSPASHHSDSSLELMDQPAQPSGKQLGLHHHHQQLRHHQLLNPFVNLGKQPFNPADFFPPLGMPLLPPHLQAAAAAAAAAANLHHAGFYPTHGLAPAPRLLFPADMAFPSVSTAAPINSSRPLLSTSKAPSSAKKFNIESMLLQHRLPASKPAVVASTPIVTTSSKLEEQDSPMDLSVRTSVHQSGGDSDRDSYVQSGDEFDEDRESNASDTLNDDDEEIEDLSPRHSPSAAERIKDPLDLTRK